MRKSIINIIILAVSIINVVLCGILVFAIVPAMTSTNKMVSAISKLIDLEYEGNIPSGDGQGTIPIKNISVYDITGDPLTITLKTGADGKTHYVNLKVSLSLNTKHKDYKTYSAALATQEALVKNKVIEVVGRYTLDEMRGYTNVVQNAILEELQKLYNSDFIVGVSFGELTFS